MKLGFENSETTKTIFVSGDLSSIRVHVIFDAAWAIPEDLNATLPPWLDYCRLGPASRNVFSDTYHKISYAMAQILVRVDEDLAKEVRRMVKEKYGGRRGGLSLIVEKALRDVVSPPAEISSSTLLEVIDYVSRASGENQPKDQILTNVFLMLDREFEQSIIKGLQDQRRGKYKSVPKGRDPVEFLRALAERA